MSLSLASTLLLDNWPLVLLCIFGVCLQWFIVKFVRHRRLYAGLPSPNHSFILGNLKTMGDWMTKYPSDFHPQPLFVELAYENDFKGLYYMDLFPFSESMVIITDPAVAAQVQNTSFPRHPFVKNFLRGLIGDKSVFSTVGAEWQRQHSWLAPAFSMQHLLTLVPGMIEETMVFRENLIKYAVSGQVFRMNDETSHLAIDIIGRTVGNIRLKSQSQYSPIQDAFKKAITWTAGQTDPLWKKWLSPVMMDWYTRKVDKLLGDLIKEKFRERKEDGIDKSILDLAVRGYYKDQSKMGLKNVTRVDLDADFMQVALDNAKVFFVGGHDTTASLLAYTIHYLSIHPSILARVRAEHDQLFGTSIESTISTLKASPHLLNKLPLTQAVLKEVLRLHPVGFTVRKSAPGATVTYQGRTYPVDDGMVVVLGAAMQRSTEFWSNPNDFDPDRFFDPETNANPAWQPFEKGPRSCIGQQLSLLEGRAVAVLVLRYFDFEAVYAKDAPSIPGWGGQAYQELKLSASPKGGIPMRARLRSNDEKK